MFLNSIKVEGLTEELTDEIRDDYNKEFKGNVIKYVTPISLVINFINEYDGGLKLGVASASDKNTDIVKTFSYISQI